jgi:hypothetical protein
MARSKDMNWTKAATGLAIVATSVGASACGSSSTSSKPDTLTRTALISKVNAICTKATTAGKAIPAPDSFEDAEVAARYFDQVAPITDTETKELLALKAGDDAKDDFAALTKAQRAANDLLQTIKSKADNKDPSGLEDLKKVQPAGAAVSAAATKLGAKACA